MNMDRITAVIPCLNEAETIERAVQEALEGIRRTGLQGEVLVADNGSTDGSQMLSRRAGARVVEVPFRGYGSALHHGFMAAEDSIVVFADADLSYPFGEIPNLIQPLRENRADFVLGSRLDGTIAKGAMPFLNRHLGTPVLSFLIRRLHKIPASDCNSGMRAFHRKLYTQLGMKCPGMEFASEMLIKVAQAGWRYMEVPIPFRKDQRSRAPHLRRWRDGWRHLRFILGHASSLPLIVAPSWTGIFLLAIAFVISLQNFWAQNQQIHFHTAFACIALALPLLMFAISNLLVKSVLHLSGQVESRLVDKMSTWTDTNRPIQGSLLFMVLVAAEGSWMTYQWAAAGWGALFNISSIIRLIVYSVCASALFSLDMGFAILRLVPYEREHRKSVKAARTPGEFVELTEPVGEVGGQSQ